MSKIPYSLKKLTAYAERNSSHGAYGGSRAYDEILEKGGIKRGYNIVDIGCGNGLQFENLSRAVGPKGYVTGIDASEKFIGLANKVIDKLPLKNVRAIHADAQRLGSYVDFESKDAVLILEVFTCVGPSMAGNLMRKGVRACKIGGQISVSADSKDFCVACLEYREAPRAEIRSAQSGKLEYAPGLHSSVFSKDDIEKAFRELGCKAEVWHITKKEIDPVNVSSLPENLWKSPAILFARATKLE